MASAPLTGGAPGYSVEARLWLHRMPGNGRKTPTNDLVQASSTAILRALFQRTPLKSLAIMSCVAAMVFASPSDAETPSIKPGLSGVSFLLGEWSSGKGKVAETGGTSTGSSSMELAANGAVILRRDRTNLFDASGKPAGGFDQIMMIYPEGGTLHADYSDGTHVIHYTSATVEPGHAVTFTSTSQAGVPTFKLSYTLRAPKILDVDFSMAPPGGTDFHPVATGSLKKED